MDYNKHYDKLINRARSRNTSDYVEKHHIIPRCVGGDDDPTNIVELTPEEHYVAHQLLIKMYPTNSGLVWAAIRMTGHSSSNRRTNNKIYGWLRRRYQVVAKQRTGKKNGSYGKSWFYDPITYESGKFPPGTEPVGWVRGRKMKPPKQNNACKVCGLDTNSTRAKFCDKHRKQNRFNGDENQLKTLLRGGYSLTKALNIMGYQNYPLSNTKAGVGKWAVTVRDSLLE